MSITISDTVDIRLEKAIAAYIRGFRDPQSDFAEDADEIDLAGIRAGALEGIKVFEGRQTENRGYPCVIVAADSVEQPILGARWYSVTVSIELHTHRNEDREGVMRAEVVHASREKALNDLLDDEGTLRLALNRPTPPIPDERAVSDLTVIGLQSLQTSADVANEAFVKRWELTLMVVPWDAPAV